MYINEETELGVVTPSSKVKKDGSLQPEEVQSGNAQETC